VKLIYLLTNTKDDKQLSFDIRPTCPNVGVFGGGGGICKKLNDKHYVIF